jgi:methionine sulfoxide reductase heme-binding subunit
MTLTRRTRRVRNHAALGAASLGTTWAVFAATQSTDPVFRASIATAYVALGLFIITVAFGPYAALRGRRYPVSTDIRRDFGIWSALVGIVHVIVGLQVHLRGKMWEYFVRPVKGALLPRTDAFGAANYTGLAAGLILVVLLATSNDVSLRRLGAGPWRSLHALVAWCLVLTLIHAVTYQFIEKRRWETVLLLLALSVAASWLRIARIRLRRIV